MATDMQVPFLGKIPLDPRVARLSDEGKSFMEEFPDSPTTVAFKSIVNGS